MYFRFPNKYFYKIYLLLVKITLNNGHKFRDILYRMFRLSVPGHFSLSVMSVELYGKSNAEVFEISHVRKSIRVPTEL